MGITEQLACPSAGLAFPSIIPTRVAPELCHLLLKGFPSPFHLWNPVPVKVTTALMNRHDQGQAGKERVCFAHPSTSLKEVRVETQTTGQGPAGRADTEAIKKCSSLACSPWLAQTAILNHQPRDGPTSPQWAGPSPHQSLIKKVNALQACLRAKIMIAFSHLRFLPLR